MFIQIRALIATVAFAPALVFAAPLTDYQRCVKLLANRLDNADFAPWSKLPTTLEKVNQATLIVRLSLTKASPSLGLADELSTESEGIRIPIHLRLLHESSFGFVVHGDREHLTEFYERINAKASNFASFALPDHLASHEPLKFPKDSILLDANSDHVTAIDAAITAQMKTGTGFSVYNVKESQPVFFVPRSQVPDDLNRQFLIQQRITIHSQATQPKSFAGWLLAKSKPLGKKTIFNFEDWSVVSASAFRRLYEWNRLHTASLPDIDEEFTAALNGYCGITCRESSSPDLTEAAKSAPSREAAAIVSAIDETELNEVMNAAGRARVLDYLRAHRGETSVTSPGGLQEAFDEIGKLIQDPQARKTYQSETTKIGIMVSEYNLLSTVPGRARFARQWRAFLRGMGNPYAQDAFTTRNLQKGISLLPD